MSNTKTIDANKAAAAYIRRKKAGVDRLVPQTDTSTRTTMGDVLDDLAASCEQGAPVGAFVRAVLSTGSFDPTTARMLEELAHELDIGLHLEDAADGALEAFFSDVHRRNARWWVDLVSGAPLQRNVGELLMLVTSELAEAMEGHRKTAMDGGLLPDDHLTDRPMFEVELADAIIRLADISGSGEKLDLWFQGKPYTLDVAGAIRQKLAYNARRVDHTDEARKAAGGKQY